MENIDIFHDALENSLKKLNKSDLEIKEHQYEAIKSVVVQGKDTVCVLPTGYGKSLIFQILPFVLDYYLSGGATATSHISTSSVIAISPLNKSINRDSDFPRCQNFSLLVVGGYFIHI